MEGFLRGLLLGFVAGLPLGPASAAVADSAMRRGVRVALAVGLGGALVDVVYCLAVAAGLGAVLRRFPSLENSLLVFGGLALVAFGVLVAVRKSNESDGASVQGVAPKNGTMWKWVAYGVAISGLNPSLAVSWVVLAGTSLATLSMLQVVFGAVGVFVGVMGWFTVVAVGSHRGRLRYGARATIVPRLVGVLLACYGFVLMARVAVALVYQ